MAAASHSIVAPEGKPVIFSAIILLIALHVWLGAIVTPGWLLIVFMAWMFRDPVREVSSAPLGIVSPVDARVISVSEEHDPYLDRQATKLALEMSPLGMNSLRSITEGKVINTWARHDNPGERAVQVQTDEQDDVVVVLRPGRLFRQISCNITAGQRVGQGQRCGYITFGAVIDVYIPVTARCFLKAGDTVQAGSELLGEYIHE
ncbi:MAG: phosphatidylserine decarboxylase [Gammaproteobacteria bacterium]|nr:phosphatidylserine decarboxylase [Gammaproteobacteria bacterium]MDH5776988.1 phosphatidylserine decarboxylase [Gammaproteobacteria bacterium]